MKRYRASNTVRMLSAVAIGLFAFICSDDAQAARRTKHKRVVIAGEIQQLSTEFVVLNNTRVELTPRTVYRDFQDNPISLNAFTVGDCVKVKLLAGRLAQTAREMEFEGDCSAGNGTVGAPPTSTPTPGRAIDDKGGRSSSDINDDCDSNKSDGRGRQRRGRGRGGDDR